MKPGKDFPVIRSGHKVVRNSNDIFSPVRICGLLLLSSSGLALAGHARFHASDDFVLTGAQEDLIWQRMGRNTPADDGGTPCECKPSMFTSVPPSVALHMWPETVTAQIPMLQPYRYATLGKLLLVVNPDDRKIVDIISPWKIVDVARP